MGLRAARARAGGARARGRAAGAYDNGARIVHLHSSCGSQEGQHDFLTSALVS